MPPEVTPTLGLPLLSPAQAQKHVTVNEVLSLLDVLTQTAVVAFGAETPPADPDDGAVYALGAAPSGVWTGQAGRLAVFIGGGWTFLLPGPGWHAWDPAAGSLRIHDGSAWVPLSPALPEQTAALGIGTAPDAVNRLAVASDGVLLTHAGTNLRVSMNKAGAADTVSLLFQTGYSGRAEIGLTGSDAYSLKVSADGTAWTTAQVVTGAGSTGIGTNLPEERFHVAGSAAFGTLGGTYGGNVRLVEGDRYPRMQIFAGAVGSNCQRTWDVATGAVYEDVDATTGFVQWRRKGSTTDNLMRLSADGNLGIGTAAPQRSLHVLGSMRLEPRPSAPSSPAAGDIYFDSPTKKLRCYDGTVWRNMF